MPTVKYPKTKMGKKFGYYTTATMKAYKSGLIEICYDKNLAEPIYNIAAEELYQENIGFLCAVHHLFLRKAGMNSNLESIAGLSAGGLDAQMQQVYDDYISTNSRKTYVNVSSETRNYIVGTWTTTKSRQAVGQLLTARNEIAQLAQAPLERSLEGSLVSKAVFTTFNADTSPTDIKVMKVLDTQATKQIVHLGGKKLSHEETMKQYAELLKAAK